MTYQPPAPDDQPIQPQWYALDPVQQPGSPGPAVWIAGLLVLVLVFAGGIVLGQSGVLDRPADTPPPGPTPTLAAPASPAVAPTPADPASPTPATEPTAAPATPLPVVTPRPDQTPGQPVDVPEEFGLFWEALEIIREHYVGRDELDDRDIAHGAIRGLVDALGDTGHSVFLTPEALQRERESLSGTIVGVGALLGERAGRPVIVSVISGGPAQRAGLRSGDALLTVDGIDVRQMAPEEIATRVRGTAGTTVVIVVERLASAQQLEFSIVREEIRIPAATWAMVPGTDIAVLRLIQFSDGAAAELQRMRDEALAAGATALILDLRSNPGGFVHEAVRVASLFLDDGTVYIRELADGQLISVPTADNVAAVDQPLVVLIDEGTASSSEIVSGALRSAGRAELVGQTTFGTGTVLLTYELSDGSAVRIAIERWLTPDGELIFGQGIEPTVEVPLASTDSPVEPDELRELTPADMPTIADPQLRRAIELLGG